MEGKVCKYCRQTTQEGHTKECAGVLMAELRALRESIEETIGILDKVAKGKCCTGEGGAFRLIHTMQSKAQALLARKEAMGKE